MAIGRSGAALAQGVWVLTGILLASVVSAPAALLGKLVASVSEDRVRLEQSAGTLWSGSANVVVETPHGAIRVPAVRWDIQPAGWWHGDPTLALEANSGALRGHLGVNLTTAGLTLSTHDLQGSLAAVAPQIPALAAIGPAGTVTIITESFQLSSDHLAGEVLVRVEGMRSARLGAMGDYRLRLTGEGAGARLALESLAGPVRIKGQGRIGMAGDFRFIGEARAQGPDAQRLAQQLAMFGMPRPDGGVALAWPIGATAQADTPSPSPAGTAP